MILATNIIEIMKTVILVVIKDHFAGDSDHLQDHWEQCFRLHRRLITDSFGKVIFKISIYTKIIDIKIIRMISKNEQNMKALLALLPIGSETEWYWSWQYGGDLIRDLKSFFKGFSSITTILQFNMNSIRIQIKYIYNPDIEKNQLAQRSFVVSRILNLYWLSKLKPDKKFTKLLNLENLTHLILRPNFILWVPGNITSSVGALLHMTLWIHRTRTSTIHTSFVYHSYMTLQICTVHPGFNYRSCFHSRRQKCTGWYTATFFKSDPGVPVQQNQITKGLAKSRSA